MTSHYYSLKGAARATGKSINTIRKAIKEGRISCDETSDTGYKIDPVELHRVFPAITNEGDDTDNNDTVADNTGSDTDVKRLQFELDNTYQRLQDKEKELQRIQSLTETNMRLLEDKSSREEEERKAAREREAQQLARIRELEQSLERQRMQSQQLQALQDQVEAMRQDAKKRKWWDWG